MEKNRAIAFKIYGALKRKGIEIGNLCLYTIEDILNEELKD